MGHLVPRLFLCLTLVLCPLLVRSENGAACGSLEINDIGDFRKLENCTHVVGHVRIAYVDFTALNLSLISFASNITEISDYLMVYRCPGLLTLESIFPRLRIIRGQALLFDEFSFVVYENRNLRELGLVELLRIQKGSIRIESNPRLCFVETVDWIFLMGNATRQHYYLKVRQDLKLAGAPLVFDSFPAQYTSQPLSYMRELVPRLRSQSKHFGLLLEPQVCPAAPSAASPPQLSCGLREQRL